MQETKISNEERERNRQVCLRLFELYAKKQHVFQGDVENEDVSAFLGIGESTVSRWLNGWSMPTTEKLLIIKEKLGCDLNYLLGFCGDNSVKEEIQDNTSIDIYDVIRNILICDMRSQGGLYDGEIIHNNPYDDEETHYIIWFDDDYSLILYRYIELKRSFEYIEQEEDKIHLIDSLIDRVKNAHVGHLPLKK